MKPNPYLNQVYNRPGFRSFEIGCPVQTKYGFGKIVAINYVSHGSFFSLYAKILVVNNGIKVIEQRLENTVGDLKYLGAFSTTNIFY